MNRALLKSLIQPAFGMSAIVLAALAQYLHIYKKSDLLAIGLFIVASACWIIAIFIKPVDIATRFEQTTNVVARKRIVSKAFGVSAAILAVLTFVFSSGNEFNPDNVLAWILSIVVFLYAFWEPEKNWHEWRTWLSERAKSAQDFFANGVRISPNVMMLIGIMIIGVFFYYYNLDGVPAEMDSDHAEKLLDVNDIVNKGLRPIFFERNTGREPLQFYLTAAFVGLTGHPIDHMALKLITALLGVLVIPFTFLFVRELFDDDVALFAALFIAFSKWSITIARMGLRFPLTPVFIAPLMFFLFRALKYQRRNDFLMAGLVLGVGLNGYNAFRIAPLLAALVLFLGLIIGNRTKHIQARQYVTNSFLMFALTLVIMMPLFRFMTEHPDQFWYRMATRLTNVETQITASPLSIVAGNIVNASLMFNWTGDEAWPNSIPGDPALDYVTGALFIAGVAYALYRLARYQEIEYAFVFIGMVVMLSPSILSIAFPNENPSVVRAGGAIPFIFTIVALPVAWLTRSIKQSIVNDAYRRLITIGGVGLILVVSMRANYLRYFVDFDESYRSLSWNSSEVASAIRSYAGTVDLEHTWILLYPHWIDTRNVAINLNAIGWEQTLPSADDARAQAGDEQSKLYVLSMGDQSNLTKLRDIFPNGQQRVYRSRTPGHDFVLYYIPGTIAPSEPLNK